MRIVIEIDGMETTAPAQRALVTDSSTRAATSPPTSPPAELIAAAAAIGANDAGPAPDFGMVTQQRMQSPGGEPLPFIGSGPMDRAGATPDISAGAAVDVPQTPMVTITTSEQP